MTTSPSDMREPTFKTRVQALSSGIIEVAVTKEMAKHAAERDKYFYDKYGDTDTLRGDKERHRKTGYTGEVGVKAAYPFLTFSTVVQYDFKLEGITFDVKSTAIKKAPRRDFFGWVGKKKAESGICDYYIFCSVKNDFSIVWIDGVISRRLFLRNAAFVTAGTVNENFEVDDDRYQLAYSAMHKPEYLKGI